jgi:hypothetical protein
MDKSKIAQMIAVDNRWLFRAIIAIYEQQTTSEQDRLTTIERNNAGYNSIDATFMSSLAIQLKEGKTLSMKQVTEARKRVQKYCGQLERLSNR